MMILTMIIKHDNNNDNNNDNDENSQRIKQTSEVPRVPPSRAFAAHAPVECWMYPKNQWSGILDDAMMHQEFVCVWGICTYV